MENSLWWVLVAARAPCDVFDHWVRWERGQVGICELVQRWRRWCLEIWNLKIWEYGELGTWKSRKLGSNKRKRKFSKFKSILHEMSVRSGLVGNKSSWPYLGPSQAISSMDRKNPKNAKTLPFSLGGPMGPLHPVWAFAAIHPRWGNRWV